MQPETERAIQWWLPIVGIIAFAAILALGIVYWQWYFNELESPDRYSPWRNGQSGEDGSRKLDANFIPQWTPDGHRVLFAITRGLRYVEETEAQPLPTGEIYEGSVYSLNVTNGQTHRLSTVRGPVELDASPQISPDGTQYAHVTSRYFAHLDRDFEIAVSNMHEPGTTRITQIPQTTPKSPTLIPRGHLTATP